MATRDLFTLQSFHISHNSMKLTRYPAANDLLANPWYHAAIVSVSRGSVFSAHFELVTIDQFMVRYTDKSSNN